MRNKQGTVLIAVYLVIVVLLIIGAAFILRSISENRVAKKQTDLAKALYIAEGGIENAISSLPDSPLSGFIGEGEYNTVTTPISGYTNRWTIVSTGSIPNSTAKNKVEKTIRVVVEKIPGGDPSGVTNAIETNGDLVVKGNATINGDVQEYASLSFEDIFGLTKEEVKSQATNTYIDPPNNTTPVDNITWVDLNVSPDFQITQTGWDGSGILVVDSDLKITGGTFDGVLWVIGKLTISGNPVITGAVFVESSPEVDTTVSGTATITFNSSTVSESFSLLSRYYIKTISWQEI
jgi:cytoskeletal protein CcmA (bactofilin family)